MLHPRRLPSVRDLDTLITIQEKIVGNNESNEDEETGWADVVTVHASKTDKAGVLSWEEYRADKLTAFLASTFIIRYRTGVTNLNRIVCNNAIYSILAIGEIGRKRYLSITAETGGEFVEST